ncbi:MAG: hypothetical protein CMN30_10165 [Sandaracinus sp.]|nr:hypothetical protein [Sandaracinus sp.]
MLLLRVLLSVALAGTSACVLEPLSLEGASCPCAPGWICDPATDTCVQGSLGRCSAEGSLTLTDLRTEWVTASQARLVWDAEGLEELFEYEVEIAASEEALLAGELLAVVTSHENPELARNRLLNANGGDPVVATTLTGLDPDTTYRARVVAEDTGGIFSCSPTVGLRTDPEPSRETPLTAETRDGARPRPTCVTYEDDPDGAASGDRYWQWVARCADTADGPLSVCVDPAEVAPTCWENIRIESLSYDFALSDGRFQGAFLELSVAIEGSEHGYWAQIGVSTVDEAGTGQAFYSRGGLTLAADGEYHRYQFPLREMGGPGGGLDAAALNRGLRSFRVGTEWETGAVIRIDDAAIRW